MYDKIHYKLKKKKKKNGGQRRQEGLTKPVTPLQPMQHSLIGLRNHVTEPATGERKERMYRLVPFHLPSSIKTLSAELTPLCHSDPPGIPWDSQDQWWVWEHRPAPFCIPQSGPTGQLLDHNRFTALSWGHLWGPWSDREHIPSAKVTSPAKGSLHPVTSW